MAGQRQTLLRRLVKGEMGQKMGIAAYNRGSKAIRDQINHDSQRPKSSPEKAYAAGIEQGRHEAGLEVVSLKREVKRGHAAFRRMQVYLTAERKRHIACIERLESFRESFRGKGVSGAAWAAIIALERAKTS